MSEKELFVENPMAIAGLFGDGVFLPVSENVSTFQLVGQCTQRILHLVNVNIQGDDFRGSCNTIHKIMGALVLKGQKVQPSDYGILNLETLKNAEQILELFAEVKPKYVVFWMNQWNVSNLQELPFYSLETTTEFKAVRCHEVITVLSDIERKQQCWSSIKALLS